MKAILLLSLTLISFCALAQTEILFGEIQRDGYEKVTKGAYWLSRPEAKAVYYGHDVPSVQVVTLDSDHFVRFAKGENNPLDINYIVFPKGEKIYKKNGQFYAAICGNRIDFLQPVTLVVVKDNNHSLQSEDISYNNGPIKKSQDYYIEPKKENQQNNYIPIENPSKKRKFNIWYAVVPVLVGILAYSLWKGKNSSPDNDDNVPGPAPTTPGDTGGPGGAPSSPGGGG